MDRALIDTDILSEILKGVNQSVAARAAGYRAVHGRYTFTTITVVEIVRGYHRMHREAQIRQFLAGFPAAELLTLDLQSSEVAGRISADLQRSGQTVGFADPLIAAIALRHDLVLVTGNQTHFQRIQALGYGLRLDNWRT